MTTVTISRWGNSSAVRIPTQIMKRLSLEDGTELELVLTSDNSIVLRPLAAQETDESLRNHLHSLLSKMKPDQARHEEVDWGTEGDELI